MLRLITNNQDQTIIFRDGLEFEVKKLLVWDEDDHKDLRDLEPIIHFNDIEFIILNNFFRIKVHLPINLRQAVVKYLNHYHTKMVMFFDCYAFANLVTNQPEHSKKWVNEYWKLVPKPWFIKRGEVIFLMEGKYKHAAVYLGYGLYISVYGAGGDLEISTLKQMKRDYKPGKIYLAEPIPHQTL